MSESADAVGLPAIVQWEGKPYYVSPMDHVEVVAAYESYLEDQAWQAIRRAKAKGYLSAEDYQEQADGIRRDIVSGVYSYGSKAWLDSIRCMQHQKQLLWLMLTHPEGQRDIPISLVDAMYAKPEKLADILRVAFKGTDPNAAAPAAPAPASR